MPKLKSKYDEKEVLRFIVAYKRANDGNSPSMRMIQHSCNISSVSMARDVILRLVEQGYIEQVDGIIHVREGKWVPSATLTRELVSAP